MELKINQIDVNPNSLSPEFLIRIRLTYPGYEFPFLVTGVLISSDGKEIATLIEQPNDSPKDNLILKPKDQLESPAPEKYLSLTMKSELDEYIINHIENTRHSTPGKDVTLRIKIYIKYFITTFKAGPNMREVDLLNLKTYVLVESVKIPQSDWVKDFTKKLNIGNYLLLELPEISLDIINTRFDNYLKPDALGNLKDKLIKSLEIIRNMKSYLEKGEWDTVMRYSREFFELFKLGKNNPVEPELRKVFKSRNGTDIGFDDFYESIFSMFKYSSKYIHELDPSNNLHKKPKAKGEDAYFTLSFCINILNILVHKV